MTATHLEEQLQQLATHLSRHQFTVATAESCTGGLLAGAFTGVAGASNWYEGGFVTYRLSAKQHVLDIHADTLRTYGAVSEVVAQQMAERTLRHCDAHVAIATTGLAGPQGDGTATAVGTLWIGWAGISGTHPKHTEAWVEAEAFNLQAPRDVFRQQAVELAVAGLTKRLCGSLP